MNKKITSAEFQQWSEEFEKIFVEVLTIENFFPGGESEKKEFTNISAWIVLNISHDNILAITTGLVAIEKLNLRRNHGLTILNNQTLDQWKEKILRKIKEQCIANGYYNPNTPPDLVELEARVKKVNAVLQDENQKNELLIYADSEDRWVIFDNLIFLKTLKEMTPSSFKALEEYKIPRELDFIFEDYVGRVEKNIKKMEQGEQQKQPNNNQNKKNLETEIDRIQSKITQLETMINSDNFSDPQQKQFCQELLRRLKDDLSNKNKEKDKINNSLNDNKKPNFLNDKLKLVAGLGIVALVISLLAIILSTSRKKYKQ